MQTETVGAWEANQTEKRREKNKIKIVEYMCALPQQQSGTQWAETKHKNLWLHYIIKWCALCFASVLSHSFRFGLRAKGR